MDIKDALQTLPHDPHWLDRYLQHLDECPEPTGTFDRHHILPQALFPDFKHLKRNPWNCAILAPADHLLAHYYLFKAFPGNRNATYAFRLMVGKGLLEQIKDDEVLVQAIAEAYQQVRYGRENVPSVQGWTRLYRGDDEATVVPPEGVASLEAEGWTRTKPAYLWVNDGRADQRVRAKDVQAWMDRGWVTGRVVFHTEAGRQRISESTLRHHQEERARGGAGYTFMPRGNSHPHRIHGIPEDVRTKISAALTGRVQSPEHVEKRRLKLLGQHWSWGACTAARRLRSEAMSGSKNMWHGTRGPMGGRRHAPLTLERMSASHKALYQDPEFAARMKAAKPRGEAHVFFGQERPAETRAKIAASASGKVQSDDTIKKRALTRAQQAYNDIPENEHRAFEKALKVKTEEEVLLIRQLFPSNSRPYNILTGLMHIRLGRTKTVPSRYWCQAEAWMYFSGHMPLMNGRWEPSVADGNDGRIHWSYPPLTPATARLGTGHPLAPNQLSAHELRKSGVSKGVTRARQAYDEIPLGEKLMLLNSWGLTTRSPGPCTVDPLVAARKNTVTRTRPYNILFGMQWILEGRATAETFERWRQAALFLRLSGCDVPLGPEAMAALNRVSPPELS